MAANTTEVRAAEFEIARVCGDLFSGLISTYTSATSMACVGIAETTDDTYNGGLIRVMGGTTYATINDYTGSSRTFTLASPGLTTAVNALLEWTGHNPRKRTALFWSINAAIRKSWEIGWYRETIVDRSSATITLASGTHSYSLPAGVGRLVQVGIQPTTTSGITWFDPQRLWRVEGEEGAQTIRFMTVYSGLYEIAWSSRVRIPPLGVDATFADAFATEPLCLKYYGRESEVASETASGLRLPLNYLAWVGSDYYSQWLLANGDANDRAILNVSLPQIQRNAALAIAGLSLAKPKPQVTVELDF